MMSSGQSGLTSDPHKSYTISSFCFYNLFCHGLSVCKSQSKDNFTVTAQSLQHEVGKFYRYCTY